MKMRLMKKCLRAARINRLIQPIACALADDKPLEMDRDACMRVLEAAHPDTGRSAIWAERLPTQGKSKIQLDVIVPAYNAEATLTECINSVLEQQTQYEFRLIVVDDGSTDGTAALADGYAAHSNVLVLHQQDGGVANARNHGIRLSDAPYLMFVDADDRLAPGAIEQLMTCVAEADADLAEGGYFNFKAGYRRAHPHKAGRMQPMEAYGMPWGKVMRRTLFERAGFPEGYWFEDSVLHQLILPGAQGCIGIADTVVERRLAAQSAGHISRGNVRSVDAVWVTLRLMRDRKALGLSNDQAHYEYLLDMAVLSQYRLEGLDEEIRKAAFGVFAALVIEESAEGFDTRRKDRRPLESALKKRQYAKFRQYCEWA